MKELSSPYHAAHSHPVRGLGILLSICALFLAAFALYTWQLGADGLWFDEAWSAYGASQPNLIAAANADATNPPLYYVLLHLHVRVAGDSEFALRFFSAAWALIAAALTSLLARRLYTDLSARIGLFALACALFLPLTLWATHEARMYTFLAALTAAAALSLHALLQREPPSGRKRVRRWAWAMVLGAEMALLYAHNTGPIAALWLNAAVAIAWLAGARARRFHPLIRAWALGQAAVLALWMPYFISRFLLVASANDAATSAPTLSPDFLFSLIAAFWLPGLPGLFAVNSALPPLHLLLLAVIPILLTDWRRAASRWMILHLALLIGGVVVALVLLQNEMHARYLVMAVPLLCALLAGMAVRWRVAVRISLVVGFAAACLLSLRIGFAPHDDARGMVRYYADRLTAADSVLMWSYADRYELAYYWPREGATARRITLPEGADLEQIAPLLPTSGDVALNIWYTQRADYRGMMGCILGDGTGALPEEYTVSGMTNRLYRQPSLRLPTLRPFDVAFQQSSVDSGGGVARIARVGELRAQAASSALCIPLHLDLLAAHNGELKAALIVRNALGLEIARTDAIFATADQRTTRQLQAGSSADAYALLRLPLGTPAGTYSVSLRLYDEVNAVSGLVPDAPAAYGRDVTLGEWRVSTGAWGSTFEPYRAGGDAVFSTDTLSLLDFEIGLPAAEPVRSGDALTVTLVWERADDDLPLPALSLRDSQGRWSVEMPPSDGVGRIIREWRVAQLPTDAQDGEAVLQLPDGSALATFSVEALPFVDQPPAVDRALAESFPGVGELAGVTFSPTAVAGIPFEVALVWQAADRPAVTDYSVSVQLIDAEGRVVAQSDQMPAITRATAGWRAGEYILDAHLLRWNFTNVSGDLNLIAALYDPSSMQRVLTAAGRDQVVLGHVIVSR